MSTWNHRVVDMTEENDGEPLFAIREVFYEKRQPDWSWRTVTLCQKTWRGWSGA
jgi:hypothetical protein